MKGINNKKLKTKGPKPREDRTECLSFSFVLSFSDGPELNCPSIYIAEEHTPHNLTCTVEGFPEPVTVWYRDDDVVELPKTLTRHDAGHYLITASNNQSNVNATVEIIVHCKSF